MTALATKTRKVLRQEFLARTGLGFNGTATGGSTSTLADTAYLQDTTLPTGATGHYVKWWATNFKAATPEVRHVTSYDNSTGTLTVSSPVWTAPIAATEYELYAFALPPNPYVALNTIIDRVLQRYYFSTIVPLSLLADADMEDSGTTSWDGASGAAAMTLVKSSSVVWHGHQSMQAAPSASSATFDVYTQLAAVLGIVEGEPYFVAVTLKPIDVGKFRLIARDADAGADIDYAEVDSTENQDWTIIAFQFTTADNSNRLQLRVAGDTQGVGCYIDDFILQHRDRNRISLPSWITDPHFQIRNIYRMPLVAQISGDVYNVHESRMYQSTWDILRDRAGVNPYTLQLPEDMSTTLWFLEGYRPYGTLSAESSTTSCPQDLVIAAMKVEVYTLMRNAAIGTDTTPYEKLLRGAKRELIAMQRMYQPVTIPHLGFSTPPVWVG